MQYVVYDFPSFFRYVCDTLTHAHAMRLAGTSRSCRILVSHQSMARLFTMRMNELLWLLLLLMLDELATGLRFVHIHSKRKRQRANVIVSIHFTSSVLSSQHDLRRLRRIAHQTSEAMFLRQFLKRVSLLCSFGGSNFETHHIGSTVVL